MNLKNESAINQCYIKSIEVIRAYDTFPLPVLNRVSYSHLTFIIYEAVK